MVGRLVVAGGCLVLVAGSAAGQDLRLAKPAAKLSHQFSSITGFRELPDGRVLVSDGIDQVLLRANLTTQKMDTVGRSGQGPGEYKSPDVLIAMPAGATLLTDLGNGRLTIYDANGKYQESFPIVQGPVGEGPLKLVLPRGSDANGRLYYQPAGGNPKADSGAVLRFDRASGKSDTVAKVKLPPLITKTSGTANNRNVRQSPPPYPLQEGWAVASDGKVALVRVGTFRVDWVLPNGTRVTGPALSANPVSVGDPEKKEYVEEQAANGLAVSVQNVNGQVSMSFTRGRARDDDNDQEAIAGLQWPTSKPPTTGQYFAAPDGTVWIERSVKAKEARVYDVIGAQGQVVRHVSLPPGRRAVGLGAQGLYAKYVDDNGVAFLERYDLK